MSTVAIGLHSPVSVSASNIIRNHSRTHYACCRDEAASHGLYLHRLIDSRCLGPGYVCSLVPHACSTLAGPTQSELLRMTKYDRVQWNPLDVSRSFSCHKSTILARWANLLPHYRPLPLAISLYKRSAYRLRTDLQIIDLSASNLVIDTSPVLY